MMWLEANTMSKLGQRPRNGKDPSLPLPGGQYYEPLGTAFQAGQIRILFDSEGDAPGYS